MGQSRDRAVAGEHTRGDSMSWANCLGKVVLGVWNTSHKAGDEELHIHISILSVTPALLLWNHFPPSEKESWP